MASVSGSISASRKMTWLALEAATGPKGWIREPPTAATATAPTAMRSFFSTVFSFSFARQLPQVGNDVRPIGRIAQPKRHVIVGYDAFGIGEPAVERRFVPRERCRLHRVGVR